ncbi:MAG: Flp pilus assembly protein CpaB [Mollicutes bacterium]|nr:Flp pilus assembly protein CpaB [Mollicutes bacterium]
MNKNNFIMALKRFIKNKNTVTILGLFAIVGILYWGYNYQINKQVNPIRNIPVAKVTIQPRTLITADMIEYVDIPPILMRERIILSESRIIGKYSNYNTVIPAGSLFYEDVVVDREDLPDASFVKVKEGDVVYNFPVTMESTYGNSIFPGNKIDIYMKAENSVGQIMVGKLIENIEVIDVKDSSGRHVFENTEERRTPAFLIFGLPPEINILLRKASYMSRFAVELFPVPHGGTAPVEGDIQVTSQNLKDFINANTVPNDDLVEQTPQEETNEETNEQTNE